MGQLSDINSNLNKSLEHLTIVLNKYNETTSLTMKTFADALTEMLLFMNKNDNKSQYDMGI